jgi:hypothetical protein
MGKYCFDHTFPRLSIAYQMKSQTVCQRISSEGRIEFVLQATMARTPTAIGYSQILH